ncbi:hypothetical protein niasHT_031012 [Heterodera trifolii]|uniref:Uncharacterized protein n=1 Tax=Heterodera trifolii TaxID=157864 RepID=A0ABD2I5X2_9BILA
MSDNPSEAEKQMENEIFISGDAWLCVFDLLPPRLLGLKIALISDRFDARVDEHFKSRRRALGFIRIWHKIGKDGKMETQIVNAHGQPLPMPTVPVPNKVVAFNGIVINYLDRRVMAFLQHFRCLFTACGTLAIKTNCARLLDLILRNIPSTAGVHANSSSSASAADDGQPLLIKWLCSPSPRSRDANILPPKMLSFYAYHEWTATTTNQIKAAFRDASSPASFICAIRDPRQDDPSYCLCYWPFCEKLTNELGEQLTVERRRNCTDCLLLVRCPILRDLDRWETWEYEAVGWFFDGPRRRVKFNDQRNRIIVCMRDGRSVGDGLIDNNNDDAAAASVPGPSVQQQQQTEQPALEPMEEQDNTFLDDNTAAVPVKTRQQREEEYNSFMQLLTDAMNNGGAAAAAGDGNQQDDDDDNDEEDDDNDSDDDDNDDDINDDD